MNGFRARIRGCRLRHAEIGGLSQQLILQVGHAPAKRHLPRVQYARRKPRLQLPDACNPVAADQHCEEALDEDEAPIVDGDAGHPALQHARGL